MRTALLLLFSIIALADPAADVLSVFSSAAEALTNDDAMAFLDKFDRSMPGYISLRSNIEGLLAAHEVGSTIEVVTDEGDSEKRTVELDWLLFVPGCETRLVVPPATLARAWGIDRSVTVVPSALRMKVSAGCSIDTTSFEDNPPVTSARL